MDISNINKDELISKGKEVTDAAYQKSLEVIERAKIRFKLQEAKTHQRRAYLELGKIAYEQIKSGDIKPDERLQNAESEIDTANYTVKLLMRELNELRGAAVCPKCGTLNPEKAKYCSECASPLHEETENK